MHIAGTGRFVFITQWIAAVVLPAFFFVGRAFVGADAGWLAVIGIVYGFFVILLLLLPPLLTVFDREVRKAKATRRWYDTATFVLWGAFLVASLTVPDAGDSGPANTALTNWTGGFVTNDAAAVICGVAGIVIGLAYLATLVFAIMGIVRRNPAA
ncbi:hypothetical protein GCM10009775_14220 [Microbacterium aoyamense]|uniref:Uncharacterized protein n=1 Tax=Microbacterium aoyamense TaxID=344166 RepID=A0ABN2PKK7_9MICO|nr:hypothetical protein [Microbacterium aoyamense]